MTVSDPRGAVAAAPHPRERERLRSLHALNVLDSPSDERFERFTALAASVFDVPTAVVSLVDENRQWFLSRCGLEPSETGRDVAFCAHALHEDVMLVIENALDDPRFAGNPLVTGAPFIRFYAGVVLRDRDALPLGTLCLMSPEPRAFDEAARRILVQLGALVQSELVLDGGTLHGRVSSQLDARIDPLTHAHAAPRFRDDIERQPTGDAPTTTAVALVVVPGLDQLNEIFGRVIGDEVLVELAARLARVGERFEFHALGRLGGRRLALCVGGGTDTVLVEAVERALQEPFPTSAGELTPEACAGVAVGRGDADNADQLLERCRAALATVGSAHGSCVALYDELLQMPVHRRLRIAAELPGAIETDAMHLVFQPKVRCEDRAVDGLECLLRWRHDELGDISPPDILDAASDVHRLSALDRWVIGHAVRQLGAWHRAGHAPGTLSINVTGVTLVSPDFAAFLADTLARHEVAASAIELEVLESSLFEDFEHIVPVLEAIRGLGIGLSLDDFGTGYSSLAYLARLPVTVLKIDRSFVSRLEEASVHRALCTAIIAMAHDLGLSVVAEGVETERQFAILKAHRCERVQGYLFSRPVPAAELIDFLHQSDAGVALAA